MVRWLAGAGVAAPLVFALLVITQSLFYDDYSSVAHPISALAAWPQGWIQNVNFVVTGLLLAAFAVGLHRAVRPVPPRSVGLWLLASSGVGGIIAGAFPWEFVDGVLVEPGAHVVGSMMSFLGAAAGLVAMSRRLKRDPAWQPLASLTLGVGVTMLALFFPFGAFALPPGAPLHPWAGLIQRLITTLWLSCTLILALRSLRVMNATTARAS